VAGFLATFVVAFEVVALVDVARWGFVRDFVAFMFPVETAQSGMTGEHWQATTHSLPWGWTTNSIA
jgi:hypothetical protein